MASNMSRPTVVGLYGVPGSGKTSLLNSLKQELRKDHFEFREGSEQIGDLVPGGLSEFYRLNEEEKTTYRQSAIKKIKETACSQGKPVIVTGHFMFWPEEDEFGKLVHTKDDLDTYTHILYLDVPAKDVAIQRAQDIGRIRASESSGHIRKWQLAEKNELRRLCLENGILFSLLKPGPDLISRTTALLRDIRFHSEVHNLSQAKYALDKILENSRLDTVLMIDGDGTLAEQDTGKIFWETCQSSQSSETEEWPLKKLFKSALRYSYVAFRQATLFYEEMANDREYDALCQEVASKVTLRPEFMSLLKHISGEDYIKAVVVTSGSRHIWLKILENSGLSETVKVVGGGRVADGYVVTPEVKTALVKWLKDTYRIYVWAFGDSPVDLGMLTSADQAVVVVGNEMTRSKSMDAALLEAINNGDLVARQALLPSNVQPRLDTDKLPLLTLTEPSFLASILHRRRRDDIEVHHATQKNAAKLLMTPTRDAQIAGPALREAHRRVGWYIAIEFLSDVIGIEEYAIPHVQGHTTSGHRAFCETEISIVALMRGGEPMALGISDAFPTASFIHASQPGDVKPHHLRGVRTVILVDSVINSGKTVGDFVQHVYQQDSGIHILVVAGVVQAGFVAETSLAQAMRPFNAKLIALRISENKFTGSGTTDTGNRLFNTTSLP